MSPMDLNRTSRISPESRMTDRAGPAKVHPETSTTRKPTSQLVPSNDSAGGRAAAIILAQDISIETASPDHMRETGDRSRWIRHAARLDRFRIDPDTIPKHSHACHYKSHGFLSNNSTGYFCPAVLPLNQHTISARDNVISVIAEAKPRRGARPGRHYSIPPGRHGGKSTIGSGMGAPSPSRSVARSAVN